MRMRKQWIPGPTFLLPAHSSAKKKGGYIGRGEQSSILKTSNKIVVLVCFGNESGKKVAINNWSNRPTKVFRRS